MGYNITKQQQIDIYVIKCMKTIHRIHRDIMEKKYPHPFLEFNKQNNFMPPPPPPKGMPPFDEIIDSKILNIELKKYDLELSTIKYDKLKKKANLMGYEDEWELYEYNGFKYFYLQDRFKKLLIKDTIKNLGKTKYIIFLTLLLNIVFISFYIFLIKKLQPLKELKRNITKFSKGDLDLDTSCNGKDEISELSNEFNNAIEQIRTLTQSRNLFLRNIMHELKTPIMKGLLVSNMMNTSKFKDSIQRAFFRLEYLLNEFAQIEEFTSQNIKINKNNFYIVEIIDNAIDILFIKKDDIDIGEIENIIINVDFEMLSLVIKNLLDNAIKYGEKKPTILVENNTLYIKNAGKQLEYKIEEYNKPFNRKYENSYESLGLGLYIVNTILKTHNLKLDYEFLDGENIFSIKL